MLPFRDDTFLLAVNMWGFQRLPSGPNKGGYSHDHFVRGNPALCRHMKRLKIKGNRGDARTSKQSCIPSQQWPSIAGGFAAAPTVFPSTSEMPPCMISNDDNSVLQNPSVSVPRSDVSSSRNVRFPRSQGNEHQVVRQQQQQAYECIVGAMLDGKRTSSSSDLFDEDALLSALSNTFEDPNLFTEHSPSDGDCMSFGGMQFFYVEDYQTLRSSADGEEDQYKASRRLSIEVGGRNGSRRRLSLIGAGDVGGHVIATANNNDTVGIPQNLFSLGPQPHQPQRAARRFSLHRGLATGASKYVLKEIVEI